MRDGQSARLSWCPACLAEAAKVRMRPSSSGRRLLPSPCREGTAGSLRFARSAAFSARPFCLLWTAMGNKSSSGSSDYTSSSDSDSSEEERATSSRQHRDQHRARGGSGSSSHRKSSSSKASSGSRSGHHSKRDRSVPGQPPDKAAVSQSSRKKGLSSSSSSSSSSKNRHGRGLSDKPSRRVSFAEDEYALSADLDGLRSTPRGSSSARSGSISSRGGSSVRRALRFRPICGPPIYATHIY